MRYAGKRDWATPAEDVHHIVSFMTTNDPLQRKSLAYDYDNLMSLCKQMPSEIYINSKIITKKSYWNILLNNNNVIIFVVSKNKSNMGEKPVK